MAICMFFVCLFIHFNHTLDMLQTCSNIGLGVEQYFYRRSFGDSWEMVCHHPFVSEGIRNTFLLQHECFLSGAYL